MANTYEYWELDKLQIGTAHGTYSASFSWDSPGFICLKQLYPDVIICDYRVWTETAKDEAQVCIKKSNELSVWVWVV
jgi:hypothetical protein